MKSTIPDALRRHLKLPRYYRLMIHTMHSLKTRGLWETGAKIADKLRQKAGIPAKRVVASDPFKNAPTKFELRRQKKWSAEPGYRPQFQLVLPLESHSRQPVLRTLRSLRRQSYPHWTLLIIVNPQSEGSRNWLSRFQSDPRIQIIRAVAGCSANASLHAIKDVPSDGYVGLVHEGDELTADALYEAACAIERQPELDVVYTDEATLAPKGKRIDRLVLKPDWSPEMLLGYNYLGGLSLFRRSIFDEVGGFNPEYGDALEWDLGLKFLENDCHFKRVPRCCYLRKPSPEARPYGTASAENAADYCRALQDYLDRQGLSADTEPVENGTTRIRWRFSEEPLVSIIIPNKNSPDLIRNLVGDLLENTSYANKEIIIVDNFSTDPVVKEFYREQEAAGSIRVVPFNQEFNYSAACNAGAREAQGEFLLFLNNDMEVISPDWLHELVGWAQLPSVGIVGTKLLYACGSLQHCGVAIGLTSIAHLWYKAPATTDWGIFGTPNSYRNCLGVTGACQIFKRGVFDEIGGYDERYQIVFSDVTICLHAWAKGYRVVYSPHAALIHLESYTRDEHVPLPDLQLFTSDIRRLDVRDDPFLHPGLDPIRVEPTPRAMRLPTTADVLRTFIDMHDLPDASFAPLDLYDEEELRQIGVPARTDFGHPRYSPANIAHDVREAIKFVLYVLLKDKRLRAAFPKAISEGVDGGFFRWLCDAGLAKYRIPASAEATIREAFLIRPGDSVRNLYASHRELLELMPNALLPSGQKRFLRWLLHYQDKAFDVCDEQILWFLLEAAEDPVREIEYTFRVSPAWQRAFPAGATAFGSNKLFDWLERQLRLDPQLRSEAAARWKEVSLAEIELAYRHNSSWQARFPLAFQEPGETRRLVEWACSKSGLPLPELKGLKGTGGQPRLAVNVLGHFRRPSLSSQSADSLVRSLERAGVHVKSRDVPGEGPVDVKDRRAFLDLEVHDVSLIQSDPNRRIEDPYYKAVFEKAGLMPRRNVYRIGSASSELEDVLAVGSSSSRFLDELWVPTRFAADALANLAAIPVLPMLPGVTIEEGTPIRREEFGIQKEDFLFLFLLDGKSLWARKNPFALVEAHRQAFRNDDRAKLLINVSSGDDRSTDLNRLRTFASCRNVVVNDRPLSPAAQQGLIRSADCYVSLHRAESFGRQLAQAMMLGKPVIATNYSGTLEYMSEDNALLVDYELQAVPSLWPSDAGNHLRNLPMWADPSVEHAANWMRWAYDHRDEAAELGLRAQAYATSLLSSERSGDRMSNRLAEIYVALRNNQQRKAA